MDEALASGNEEVVNAFVASGASTQSPGGQSCNLEAMKTAASKEQWAIEFSEVSFGKCLSETVKSAVFLATWRGSQVVAKSIKTRSLNLNDPEMSDDTKKIAREELLHEMRLLSTLRHPDLVLFLGACLDNEPFFFLIEFMEGGDLETYMKTQMMKSSMREWKPSYEVALKWIVSVARALAFLHSCTRPVIHRDLKPLNLLLTRTLELKVTDFGLSKIMNRKSIRNGVPNPAPQMFPLSFWLELAAATGRLDAWTSIS